MRPAGDRQGCRPRALTSALAVLFATLELSYSQRISCHTTQGVLNIMLHRDWAPESHARFMELLDSDFFSDQVFYGVKRREWIQFGIPADPAVTRAWRGKAIADDPNRPELQARRGQLSFQADQHGRRETRLMISDSRTRTAVDRGAFERPFGQVLNTEILDKLYDGYGDTSKLVPLLAQHGNVALAHKPNLDRIHRCDIQFTALEAEVESAQIKAQVGNQLKHVESKSQEYLRDQALAGIVQSSGKDSEQLFDTNIRSPRADPKGSAAEMHDTVFKALSKTAADSIRVLSGAPDPLTPCLPTPDGATPGTPTVKGLPLALQKSVQSQVRKQVDPDIVCEMQLVAADTGCFGNLNYKEHFIAGAEWTTEKGGQYRLRDLNLKQSLAACARDDACKFIWISVLDEIAARGWGSRALHECKRRHVPDHNLYEKVCFTADEKRAAEGVPLSYLQAQGIILAQMQKRAGQVRFDSSTIKQVFAELDKNRDALVSKTEMMRLDVVVNKRWGANKTATRPRAAKTVKKNYTPDRYALSEKDMLRLFDEDKDGTVSRAERLLAGAFMLGKSEL